MTRPARWKASGSGEAVAVPCPKCGGHGWILDQRNLGASMRKSREAAGLSMSEVARRLGVSAAFLSDLERGNRAWSNARVESFRRAIGEVA